MKEAIVALGIVFVLGGAMAALYSAYVLKTVDRAETVFLEHQFDFNDPLESIRSIYTATLVAGIVALLVGAGMAIYGWRSNNVSLDTDIGGISADLESWRFCQHCGAHVDAVAVRCPSCGRLAATESSNLCEHCGAPVDLSSVQCPSCGRILPDK